MRWVEVYRNDITALKEGTALKATLRTAEACGRLARARVDRGSLVIEVRAPVPKAVIDAAGVQP